MAFGCWICKDRKAIKLCYLGGRAYYGSRCQADRVGITPSFGRSVAT
jgi:hypothetical protein